MRRWPCAFCAAVVCIMPFVGLGCGDKPAVSTSTEEATVTGTVKVHGKLLTGGAVVFDPANSSRTMAVARTVPIGVNGTYKVTTLVGQNTVRIILPRKPGALPSDGATANESKDIRAESAIEYEDIVFEVKSGDNRLDIEFPRPTE